MKILFITATRIGDAVLSTGLLAHLLEQRPGARVTIACGAPAAPLFGSVPGLERVIVLRKKPLHGHWLGLWAQCAGRIWDVVVDLRGSAIGWTLPARTRYRMRARDDSIHRVEALARVLGVDPPPAPRLWADPAAEAEVALRLPAGAVVLSVAPTANWAAKQWPAARFAELVSRLTGPAGPLSGATVAVHGGPDERELARPVLAAAGPGRALDLVGAPLPVAHSCFRRSALYVGNDSGLTHLAAASGTPTLALFGPTRERNYAPWGPKTAVVRTCESFEELVLRPGFDHRTSESLMEGLSVDAAERAAVQLWERCGSETVGQGRER